MDHRGDPDHEKVERAEDFGIHSVAVHLVADGMFVVYRIRMEEGEIA